MLLAVVGNFSLLFGGQFMDISFRHAFFPTSSISNNEGEFKNSGVTFGSRFPFFISQKFIFSPGASYKYSKLDLIHRDVEISERNLHAVTVAPRVMYLLNGDWSFSLETKMEYKSDETTGISMDGTSWNFMFTASRKFSNSLRFSFGLIHMYSPFLEKGRIPFFIYAPLPVVVLNWKITEEMKLNVIVPHVVSFTYRFNKYFQTGIFTGMKGVTTGGHIVSVESEEENAKAKFKTIGIGGGISNRIYFTKMLSLDLSAGYSFYRYIVLASKKREYISRRIPNTPFVLLNFSWGF